VDPLLLAEIIGAVILAAGGGGGTVHLVHRRRNGRAGSGADLAQQEVLRQGLHEQRHGETLRILADVTTTTANAAAASEKAAKAAEKSATATEEIVSFINERHPRAPLDG
jgi:hypothetical protein